MNTCSLGSLYYRTQYLLPAHYQPNDYIAIKISFKNLTPNKQMRVSRLEKLHGSSFKRLGSHPFNFMFVGLKFSCLFPSLT